MLTLSTDGGVRTCDGTSRRDFLTIGSLGLGGLALSDLLTLKARAGSSEGGSPVRDKAVVVLYLAGGATHIETFDPKMTAPVEIRSMTGEVKTSLPGVTFGGTFPLLAKLAHKMAIVRSYRHGNGSHLPATEHVISGGNPTKAMLGSVYARVAGLTSPLTGIPTNIILDPAAVGDEFKDLQSYRSRLGSPGTLGSTFAPFDPSAGSEIKKNMQLRIPRERLDDRRTLLRAFDQLRDETDLLEMDKFRRQAFDVILGGVGSAFDLDKESPTTLDRYDTSKFTIPKAVLKKKRNTTPKFQPIALGKQMLLARRLIEAGTGFVTVTSSGWDMHGNAFGIDDGMPVLGPAVDKAVSAFLEDLEDRGLSEKVLLVITGEFGRTPKINKKGGRDHWGNLNTLAFVGGGLNMGQVIGQSDSKAGLPASDPVTTDNVAATILQTLFDPGILRLTANAPKEIVDLLSRAEPVRHLS